MPGKIIVKQDGHAPKSAGGIIFTDKFQSKDRPMTGLVMAVGVGKPCKIDETRAWDMAGKAWHQSQSQCTADQIEIIQRTILKAVEIERVALPVSVKAGDRVVFKVYAGDGIEWTDGSMCRCLTEDDILARIEE